MWILEQSQTAQLWLMKSGKPFIPYLVDGNTYHHSIHLSVRVQVFKAEQIDNAVNTIFAPPPFKKGHIFPHKDLCNECHLYHYLQWMLANHHAEVLYTSQMWV